MHEIAVRLELSDAAMAPHRLDKVVTPLAEDLRELGMIEPAGGAPVAEPGAKGDPVTLGTVLVALIASPVLTALVGLARDWVAESRHRSVKLTTPAGTIKIDHASREEQQRLIEQWIAATNRPDGERALESADGTAPDPGDGPA